MLKFLQKLRKPTAAPDAAYYRGFPYMCVYCKNNVVIDDNYQKESSTLTCKNVTVSGHGMTNVDASRCDLKLSTITCPACGKTAASVCVSCEMGEPVEYPDGTRIGTAAMAFYQPIFPLQLRHLPEYVPAAIREDYAEAYSILYLSPKAAATLARRCLQGMIRDYWGVSGRTLYDEINAIKDRVHSDVWESIDAVRKIGNIGAHMEKDVDQIINV